MSLWAWKVKNIFGKYAELISLELVAVMSKAWRPKLTKIIPGIPLGIEKSRVDLVMGFRIFFY